MNQDDTFRRLRRVSFQEANHKYLLWLGQGNINDGGIAVWQLLHSLGWTWKELRDKQIEANGV